MALSLRMHCGDGAAGARVREHATREQVSHVEFVSMLRAELVISLAGSIAQRVVDVVEVPVAVVQRQRVGSNLNAGIPGVSLRSAIGFGPF